MMGVIIKVYSSKEILDHGDLPDIEEFSSFWYHIDYNTQILTCCNIVKLENYKREYPFVYLVQRVEHDAQVIVIARNW